MSGKTKITVLGLGTMGTAIARTFLKNEHETTVWNRSDEKAKKLSGEGAIVSLDLREAIINSPVILICVLDYNVVNTIFESFEEDLRGKIVVNLTNGTPEQAENTAKVLSQSGARYIDGGILAIPPAIGTPHASILYSGNEGAFKECSGALDLLGQSNFIGNGYGLASLYDLSLLSAMYGMFGGYFHALGLLSSVNIKAAEFTPMVTSWLNAMMNAFPHLAQQVDAKDYSINGVVSSIATNISSINNIIEASEHKNLRTDFLQPWKLLLHEAREKGHGENDLSAILDLLKN